MRTAKEQALAMAAALGVTVSVEPRGTKRVRWVVRRSNVKTAPSFDDETEAWEGALDALGRVAVQRAGKLVALHEDAEHARRAAEEDARAVVAAEQRLAAARREHEESLAWSAHVHRMLSLARAGATPRALVALKALIDGDHL